MRFIVYGAGAVGSVIGAHLFRSGKEVVLVGNRQHVDAINQNGLKLVTSNETFRLPVPSVKTANDLLPFRDDDVVLLCAKSQHTVRCLGQLKRSGARRRLPIFCFQNSIWNEPTASRIFENVCGVMVYVEAIFLVAGEVINPVTGNLGFLEVGRYPSGSDSLCEIIVRNLNDAGFSANTNGEIMKSKAAKCLLNLSNAMIAITDGKGNSHAFMDETRKEAKKVWSEAGIEWEDEEVFLKRCRERGGTHAMPPGYESLPKTSGVSSWQSLARGVHSIEAGQLNGDIVTLGGLLGLEAPYNELLWKIAARMARRGEKPGFYSADQLASMIRKR